MQIFFVSVVRFFLICIRHIIIKGALPYISEGCSLFCYILKAGVQSPYLVSSMSLSPFSHPKPVICRLPSAGFS